LLEVVIFVMPAESVGKSTELEAENVTTANEHNFLTCRFIEELLLTYLLTYLLL